MSKEEFEEGIEKGLFLEYANVYGNYYGTPRDQVERNLKEGYDSLLVIDVQGAFKVKKIYPDAVSIFLLPPSMDSWERKDDRQELRVKECRRRGSRPPRVRYPAQGALITL
ncbi:MAG: hypothetical protein Q9N34_01455 [Aquificota bacterium]|nr:hypothetical protein [Aquificota bacterium]